MAKFRNKETQQEPEVGQGAPELTGKMTSPESDRERVAQRAYELYLERGGVDGQDMDDWLSAERELTGGPRGSSGPNE
jgi:hypothetical protein